MFITTYRKPTLLYFDNCFHLLIKIFAKAQYYKLNFHPQKQKEILYKDTKRQKTFLITYFI